MIKITIKKIRTTICIPLDDIFKNTPVKTVQAEVKEIRIGRKEVVSGGGLIFGFDFLVIALGSAVSTFGIPGVAEYAFKFKDIDQAIMIIDKIYSLYGQAKMGERGLPLKIAIGVAGFKLMNF